MKYADRTGRIHGNDTLQDRFLRLLYGSLPGRVIFNTQLQPRV